MSVELSRTVRVELRVTAAQSAALLALRPLVTAAYNEAARYAWDHPEVRGAVDLHHAVYRTLRAKYTMPSQFVCNIQRLAMGSVAALRKRQAAGCAVSCPEARSLPIPYDVRTMKLRPGRDRVTLSTLHGRIDVRLRRHAFLARYTDWKTDSGKVTRDEAGRFWLALTLTRAVVDPVSTGPVVGCDRGIVNPAVLSTGAILGDPRWHGIDRKYLRTQRSLQRKGTKSAKRRAKRRSQKWSRFRDWADWNLTKTILSALPTGTVLALEDLTNIRTRGRRFDRRTRRRIHAWSFRRQQTMLESKAPERGVAVVYVDARYTSQKCSVCGYVSPKNRKSQARFYCEKCGHAEHADLNAAKNVAANWVASQPNGDPPVVGHPALVNPPHVDHDQDLLSPKTGRGLRGSGLTKGRSLRLKSSGL